MLLDASSPEGKHLVYDTINFGRIFCPVQIGCIQFHLVGLAGVLVIKDVIFLELTEPIPIHVEIDRTRANDV